MTKNQIRKKQPQKIRSSNDLEVKSLNVSTSKEEVMDRTAANAEKIAEDEKAEIRLLYTLVISDCKFVKEQQWRIINYVIASYIAVFGVWKSITNNVSVNKRGIEFWMLLVFGFVSLIVGWWLIKIEQHLLQRSRQRIGKITETFTVAFEKIYKDVLPPMRDLERKGNYYVQQGILVLGYVFLVFTLVYS